jgi:hypothetical protein
MWVGNSHTIEYIVNINIWSYLIFNWLELVVLVVISYLIRNIRDQLNISWELYLINACWIFFSTAYMGLTFYDLSVKDNYS